MEASSRTKSPTMLRALVLASNLLVALVAILAIFEGVALCLDSSRIQKVQVLKVRGLSSNIKSFDSKETTESNGRDIRRHKFELQPKTSSSRGEGENISEESTDPLPAKSTTRSWRNFPYVLVAVGVLTLLTTLVGLQAVHREPVFLLLALAALVSVLVVLQTFALGVLLPLEGMQQQTNQNTALKQPTIFASLQRYLVPVLAINCALSFIVLNLCFVQFVLHRHNTQSPFKILQPI